MPLIPSGVTVDEDHRLVLDAVRDYAVGELLPLESRWDVSDESVSDILPTLSEMGLLSLGLPEDDGGLGCPFRIYAAIIHELARCSPSTAVTLSVHSMVCKILAAEAGSEFRDEYITAMGAPENLAAFCLSEAGAGSDAGATRCSAKKTEGGYLLNGEKMWITNGMKARWFLTLARLEGQPPRKDLCAFVVDGRQAGLQRNIIHGKMGLRGSETAVIAYSDVFVPDHYLLSNVGEGLRVFLSTLNEGRIGIAAQSTGIADACLEEMTSYAREREQFGRPIGELQAVGNMLADSATEFAAARLLAWRAACHVDEGWLDRTAASMAKLYASESANRIAYRAVQVHGGSGYVNEFRVERLYRDVRVTTIYEGTSEIQRLVIARELGRR